MCNPASFIVTKDRTYWSKLSDNHHDIITEHHLEVLDTMENVGLVRTQVTPPDGDFSKPLSEWQFSPDQGILPDWYNAEWGEAQSRAALVDWAAFKIISEGKYELSRGNHIVIGHATVEAWDHATVRAWDHATVEAWDHATVQARDHATVEAWDHATVRAWDHATIWAGGHATIWAGGHATVQAGGHATVQAGDHATVHAWNKVTVHAWGHATVQARDHATVQARDHAAVWAWDHATVNSYGDNTIILTGLAVWIDRNTNTIHAHETFKVELPKG